MALGDSYAVAADLEARLGTTDPGSYGDLLAAASRAVELFTGRQFNKTTVATAREYRAVDAQRLPVDDFHTMTDLAINVENGTAWVVADVDPRPWNGVFNGQTGWPYFDLFAVNRIWPWSRRAKITVTAQWGWDAVPEAIKQATLDVASLSIGSSGAGVGTIASERLQDWSASYVTSIDEQGTRPEFARAKPYRRQRFGVA